MKQKYVYIIMSDKKSWTIIDNGEFEEMLTTIINKIDKLDKNLNSVNLRLSIIEAKLSYGNILFNNINEINEINENIMVDNVDEVD